jgi:YidC/Oxa1 family membrane protein insertase
MGQGGSLRFIVLALGGLLLFLAIPRFFGGGDTQHQPVTPESQVVPDPRAEDLRCHLWSPAFHAEVRTRGGTLTRFELLSAKYRRGGEPLDVSTTPDPAGDHEFRQQLMTRWRSETPAPADAPYNVDFDSFDYELTHWDDERCELTHRGESVELKKVYRKTGRPYELEVASTIVNRAEEPRTHAFSVDTTAWRLDTEVEGKMLRISPYVTHVVCTSQDGDSERLLPGDFEPGDFKGEAFARNTLNPLGEWFLGTRNPAFAAVSNAYFAHAIVPIQPKSAPACLLQIEDRWDFTRYQSKKQDPNAGAMYRARLAYPPERLAPGASATYRTLTYAGPKERTVLAAAGGGEHKLDELIDLGFFAAIAKVLVRFLLWVHGIVPNWGIAIIVLTLTARTLLFPLSLPGIRNMIRMREIKPEMDALNAKFKDDPQQRGLAQMELWRKHNVNPFKGCLPQLASMPVWFALYTTLQSAVELYNIPFLWFPDLSEPDPIFVLPFIIGGTFFLQQKLMPMQGGDPAQQKMMLYFMPGMFTVMMLFLPAGLGIYMFTNSLLAILQQQLVERHTRRRARPGPDAGDIQVRDADSGPAAGSKRNKKKGDRSPRSA